MRQEGNLLEDIRAACAEVMRRATYVRVETDRIEDYAVTLPLAAMLDPEIDPQSHFLGGPGETVAFFVTLDAVNFGSGYFPHLRKRANMSGYTTIATALKEHFERRGPFSAAELAGVTPEDCARIFGQEPAAGPIAELMSLFARSWNDLGRLLHAGFAGSYVGLVEAAHGSAEQLVRLLDAMPLYHDVSPYGALTVPFYKRAQITAADLSLALEGHGVGRFDDLDRLTIFADNLVPHVLRVDGMLCYDPALAAAIDAGELIAAGSPQEVEIRAAAVHVVELLVAALRRQGHHVTARGLDHVLWSRGGGPYYKALPRHRTRTVFY